MAEVEVPELESGELLIAVHAVGVTPTELLWFPTTHRKSGEPRADAFAYGDRRRTYGDSHFGHSRGTLPSVFIGSTVGGPVSGMVTIATLPS